MLRIYFGIFFLFLCTCVLSQRTIENALKTFNSGTVEYITVEEFKEDSVSLVLDTREMEEFEVSHLHQAYWVGYKTFEIEKIQKQIPDISSPIVVYCSIGVRSEKIGERLKKAGYSNVRNLYGGIFKWKINGQIVVDSNGEPTERVHAFSKLWGDLLTNAEKVYSSKTGNR